MKSMLVDELPLRCHQSIKSFFRDPSRHPDHFSVSAHKAKSRRGYPIWEISFYPKKKAFPPDSDIIVVDWPRLVN